MIVQNLAVQRGQWLSFLCCYIICELEKTICPLPRLKFILNSIQNARVPMNPQRVISATRGWEYFQNRRQKVFNRGALGLCGWIDTLKIDKISTDL